MQLHLSFHNLIFYFHPTVPDRTSWEMKTLQSGPKKIPLDTDEAYPPTKKARVESSNGGSAPQDLMVEVETFASIISHTLELEN
jgi:hypothetical protein